MNHIKTIVQDLCRKYQTNSPQELIQSMDIDIHSYPFANLRGMAIQNQEQKAIIVKDGLPFEEENYILAHELGHLILHQGSYFFICSKTNFLPGKYEKEADLFAAYLLLTDADFQEEESCFSLSQKTGLPVPILEEIFNSAKQSLL
ncbi:MAG: ImmA/IrrE family metallo-endopeptidase [Clostridiales bacterium]